MLARIDTLLESVRRAVLLLHWADGEAIRSSCRTSPLFAGTLAPHE
jgi:hypothetical protein